MSLRSKLFPFLTVVLAFLVVISSVEIEAAKSSKSSTHGVGKKVHSKKVKSRSKRKHRRSRACNTVVGKHQALELLKSGSPELQMLAGVGDESEVQTSPALDVSVQKQLLQEVEDITDLQNEEDAQIDADNFRMLWLSYVDPVSDPEEKELTLACGIPKQSMMNAIMEWLGTRYHFGGTGRTGIDCSAFVRAVFASSANLVLPRTAQSQIEVGQRIRNVEDLQFGDLVFFHTARHAYVSHVGIYLGNNLFAHSSSRFGVTVSPLNSDYYSSHLVGARRLTENDVVALSAQNTVATGTH
jgi:lipoprotein Spr